jgi:V-type H+-transporting ATPase subunit H
MISEEDYNFIVAFDSASGKEREAILQDQRHQCAKTFLNLMGHVSKNQTIYYVLVLIDDMFTVSGSAGRISLEIVCVLMI